MSLNLGGLATLSSITLSRPGGDDGETLATLKLPIGTKDTDPVCAALGTESGDALEWGVGTASGVAGGAVVSDLSHDSPGVQGLESAPALRRAASPARRSRLACKRHPPRRPANVHDV